MQFSAKFEKGEARPLANAMRHFALARVKSWKIIGYSMSVPTNILHSSGQILEDIVEFNNNLSKLNFEIDDSSDVYIHTVTFSKNLNISDLNSPSVHVAGGDGKLLTVLDDSQIKITFYLLNACGGRNAKENTDFLESRNLYTASVICLASRHSDLEDVSFDVIERFDIDELKFTIKSKKGNEQQIIKESAELLLASLKKFLRAANSCDSSQVGDAQQEVILSSQNTQ